MAVVLVGAMGSAYTFYKINQAVAQLMQRSIEIVREVFGGVFFKMLWRRFSVSAKHPF